MVWCAQVLMWLPDCGLNGFMHFKILGVDNLPVANQKFLRYVDVEIGKGRHSLRTEPVSTVRVAALIPESMWREA